MFGKKYPQSSLIFCFVSGFLVRLATISLKTIFISMLRTPLLVWLKIPTIISDFFVVEWFFDGIK